MSLSNPDADPRLFKILSEAAINTLNNYKSSIDPVVRIKNRITRNLQMGRATLTDIASDLAMSERTLQRLLAKNDTDLGTMLMDTRMGVARVLLRREELSLLEIADACGYSSSAAFSRAVTRTEGMTPSELRKVLLEH